MDETEASTADPTVASPLAADALTEGVLAYSTDETPQVAPYVGRSWRSAARAAGLLVSVGVLCGGVVLLARAPVFVSPPAAAGPAPSAAPAPDPGPFIMPTNTADHLTPDGMFKTLLRQRGIRFDPDGDYSRDAHNICSNYDSPAQAAEALRDGLGWDLAYARAVVDATVAAYCPWLG
jgi:hypothetical protein